MPPSEPRRDAAGAPEQFAAGERQTDEVAATRDQLLALVLSETLNRPHDDGASMVRALRRWRDSLADPTFDSGLVQRLVPEVLRHRTGSYPEDVLESLCQDVAAVLWNDPQSRQRLQRLWQSLETER